ncbi:radical SAM protein [Amycolatopsis eburnea]|uniref:Radical SAM protein n=1 Tax=Amycolatopsis eburnea TaxID=2267691 RepID=A0A427THF3_9PSEU|nr:radical SAM protein [Amycolatopsis eburnea]RSD22810.1 radical SAM protein [Amycolatopsis eburnea]
MATTSPGTATAVATHGNGTAFVFVPNLCNAACAFCYVQPGLSRAAHASKLVLRRARVAAEALAALGFREVRFTGGEPTIFANLPEIIEPFLDSGLRYRVLTNAIDIEAQLPFFGHHPPERFTISVHDTTDPSSTFGVPISPGRWAENRRRLASISEVEATFVLSDAAHEESVVHHAIGELADDGVRHIKLILENSHQQDAEIFSKVAGNLRKEWGASFKTFRFTETRALICKLPDRAFPSIDLGHGAVYACCVQVGDRHLPSGHFSTFTADVDAARNAIGSVVTSAMAFRAAFLPCSGGSRFCPIALDQ